MPRATDVRCPCVCADSLSVRVDSLSVLSTPTPHPLSRSLAGWYISYQNSAEEERVQARGVVWESLQLIDLVTACRLCPARATRWLYRTLLPFCFVGPRSQPTPRQRERAFEQLGRVASEDVPATDDPNLTDAQARKLHQATRVQSCRPGRPSRRSCAALSVGVGQWFAS